MSSHFHVIQFVEVEGARVGVEIYSSKTAAWIFKKSELGEVVLFYVQNQEVFFLMVLCTWLSTL
jgi:hypothetical protein